MSETKRAKLQDLTPDNRNANRGTQRGLKVLDDSLRQFGAGRSILLDREGRIIAGNKTAERAADLGMDDVLIVETDGSQLVAVKRTDLDLENGDGRARRMAYYDNRAGELNLDWDADQLKLDIDGGLDLSGLWDEEELSSLFGDKGTEQSMGIPPPFSEEQIIESAFHYFRSTGFPYRRLPVHVSMQEINKLASTDQDVLLHTGMGYHVADTYHPHRFHASAEGMKSPVDGFNDDKLIRRAMHLALGNDRTLPEGFWDGLKIVSGVQMCSNFRPGFALYYYRLLSKPGAVVLDCSTGYGGRLVGFMASHCSRYIGIDPNKPTHEGNLRMAAELGFSDKVELYNLPAEDVDPALLAGRCDFSFTSPPYFAKEHYSEDDTQSWVRYKTGDEWRDGFLMPMMALQFAALKPGSYAVVNIADVKLRNKVYPLEAWTVECGKMAGFEHIETKRYTLTNRFGAGHEDDEVAVEPVIVFQKRIT